jgi:hypothetical protein
LAVHIRTRSTGFSPFCLISILTHSATQFLHLTTVIKVVGAALNPDWPVERESEALHIQFGRCRSRKRRQGFSFAFLRFNRHRLPYFIPTARPLTHDTRAAIES